MLYGILLTNRTKLLYLDAICSDQVRHKTLNFNHRVKSIHYLVGWDVICFMHKKTSNSGCLVFD